MNLEQVTKLDKRNKATSKRLHDDVMLQNYDVIEIFPVFCQFEAIWRPDSRRIICKTYIFTNSNVLSYKN